MTIQELDQTYVAHTYGRFPLVLTEGKGSLVRDENGKQYIDLGTGIAVNGFGIADDEWLAAITAQAARLNHTSNLYYSAPCAKLAQMLCERTGMKKVFFSNSGAEANECAIKAARKYAELHYPGQRDTILTLTNSFHGRTITTLAATGQDVFHKDFLPLTGGFASVEPTPEALEAAVAAGNVTAVMFEAVQGEGGVLPLTQAFADCMQRLAKEHDILLIADEVQAGNGRTGALCGYMNLGLQPDIVSTAKGLAGGLPMGATLLGEKVQDVYTPGSHGSTFGGNPVCAAGAISVLSRLDEALLAEVRAKSDYIVQTLQAAPGVKSVSGMGLMLGVETAADASAVIRECMARGVLVIKAKQKVRLLPALNIPWPLLKQAVETLCAVCAELEVQA
ncbi:MAG: aminotransferase class III-fold pyridoxal phosphate-dependent enzyme [Clostridiales bacterium]|nr:aminotransferase class III-fold pyridoxal phosphate-dependent enzyme [Clostridiales bacterium]